MNVSLTPELERLVNEKVESGLYQTAEYTLATAVARPPVSAQRFVTVWLFPASCPRAGRRRHAPLR